MSVNAREETYEVVELFGSPALFTNSRISRDTIPAGIYCCDLRGSDFDPDRAVTVEPMVCVNHAGTVLTLQPISIPQSGFRRIEDSLHFSGEDQTLAEFLKSQGVDDGGARRPFHE